MLFLCCFPTQLANFIRRHFVGAFGDQVHPMGIENGDGRFSTACCHRGRWKNVITTEINFSVDLSANGLLVRVGEETAARRLEFRWRLAGIEMKRKPEL